jgi:hypothetical protein
MVVTTLEATMNMMQLKYVPGKGHNEQMDQINGNSLACFLEVP